MEGCTNVFDKYLSALLWVTLEAIDKKLNDNTKVKNAVVKNNNVKVIGDKGLAIYEESKCYTLFYY